METITVNRFKSYRKMRWYRSDYLWGNPYLSKFGIDVQDDTNRTCDVLAIPCPHVPGKEPFTHRDDGLFITRGHKGILEFQDTPIICDSSLDYAYLDHHMLGVIAHPQVRKYMPNVGFRNAETHLRRSWGGEYYGMVLLENEVHGRGTDPRQDREEFTSNIREKICKVNRPPTPPFSNRVMEYIQQNMKPLKDRPIDCFFSGRVLYAPLSTKNLNHPTRNRKYLYDKWHSFPGNNIFRPYGDFGGTRWRSKPIKTFNYPYEYVDALLNSKVVISPWGWSPWCVRDFEALMCGCTVIKQECSNLLTWPDIYNPKNQLLVWTDIFFNNTANQIDYCLNHLPEMQQRADNGVKFMLDAMYPLDKLYESWTSDLREFLEDALSTNNFTTASNIPLFREDS